MTLDSLEVLGLCKVDSWSVDNSMCQSFNLPTDGSLISSTCCYDVIDCNAEKVELDILKKFQLPNLRKEAQNAKEI